MPHGPLIRWCKPRSRLAGQWTLPEPGPVGALGSHRTHRFEQRESGDPAGRVSWSTTDGALTYRRQNLRPNLPMCVYCRRNICWNRCLGTRKTWGINRAITAVEDAHHHGQGTFAPRSNAPLRSGFPGKQSGRTPSMAPNTETIAIPPRRTRVTPAAAATNRDPHLNDSTRRKKAVRCHIFAASGCGQRCEPGNSMTGIGPDRMVCGTRQMAEDRKIRSRRRLRFQQRSRRLLSRK